MPKHTPEQKRAKQAVANAKAKVRALMIAGDVAGATAHAEKSGFKLFDARLGPEYQNEAEPEFKALEEAMKLSAEEAASADAGLDAVLAAVDASQISMQAVAEWSDSKAARPVDSDGNAIYERDGWPLKSEAVVYRLVPNPRLVVIQLPDKRQVAMLKGRGCTYRVHQRLRAFLVKTEPEALYDHDFTRA